MAVWVCVACGVEHEDSEHPPISCLICEDERQYVPPGGQRWTTYAERRAAGAIAQIAVIEPGLHRISVEPHVGIGQQAMLVGTPDGNLLWEPPSYIDDDVIAAVRALGGVAAVTASHPHLTGASVSWSDAFDGVPVYVASADRSWIRRPSSAITLWSGAVEPLPGITLVQCGGHFPGSSMLHWADGAAGRGVMLTGDTIFIGADRTSVSALRSYPNRIPLPERAIRTILAALEPYRYDRLYGSFGQVIDTGARHIVLASLERYIGWIRGDLHGDEPVA